MSSDKHQSEVENTPDDEVPQEELSLDQLSQAYAKVLQVRKRETGDLDEAPVENADPASAPTEQDPGVAMLDLAVAQRAKKRKRRNLDEIDALDNAPCPISPESILEAILFVGAPKGEKLTGRKIAAAMRDVSPGDVKKMAEQLNMRYKKDNAAYRVVIEGGNYSLQLHDDLEHVQNHFFGRNRAAKLSQTAIDVLAVIAYNQPVTREHVEKICGRPIGPILSQLVRRNLLDFEQKESRPLKKIYRTTERFLNLFRLDTIDDLPRASSVSDIEELAD